jgi:hypothetical protein
MFFVAEAVRCAADMLHVSAVLPPPLPHDGPPGPQSGGRVVSVAGLATAGA